MAYSFSEDNEATFFATASDSCSTNFDNLFDLDSDYPSLDTSDASTSHGSSSTDTNFFDDLGFETAFLANSFCTTRADISPDLLTTDLPTWMPRQGLDSTTPLQNVPKTVRLVYRTRPESMAITGAQLIALENKDIPHPSMPLTTLRSSFLAAPTTTPPTTPHHNRSQLSAQPRKQARRMHRIEKSSNHSRPAHKPALMPGSPKAMSSMELKSEKQQAQTLSPQLTEWNERIRCLAIQVPQHSRTPPVSPPPSGKFDQNELSQNTPQTMALDIQDDFFNPSSSATTVSSTELTHPFLDDSSPSTIDSSPFNLDAAAKLFGLKQDPWDLPTLDLGNASPNPAANSSSHRHDHLNDTIDNPFSTISDTGGIGISIGTDDLGTNPFTSILTSTNPSSESHPQAHSNFNSDSTKLPTMPFNSPVSEFCSPALSSDLPFTKTNMVLPSSSPPLRPSKLAHTTPKHRRTKSASSIQSATHRSSSSKLRTPKTPKEKTPVVGGLGFVNFTPEDRTRILTGVAPSGSSKTKARREKEALERRRKLSEAAKRLVVEAGGDGDAVDRELSE